MEIKVFYAWQSDLPSKVTRSFILAAAQAACARLSDESGGHYSVVIDQATEGEPGMCDIPNAILQKIAACDVFMADLTFVGETVNGKLTSNPNILFELGYAAKSKGFSRILAVANCAYGEPNDQMFDIKRRRAIRYALSLEDAADSPIRKKIRDALANEIYKGLKVIITKRVVPAAVNGAPERFAEIRSGFEDDVRSNRFGQLTQPAGTVAMCIVPDGHREIPYSKLLESRIEPPGNFPSSSTEAFGDAVERYNGTFDKSDLTILRYNVARISTNGILLAADSWCLSDRPGFPRIGMSSALVGVQFIPSTDFERLVISWLNLCLPILYELGLKLPWRVGISLIGVEGYRFLIASRELSQRVYQTNDIFCAPIRIGQPSQFASVQDIATAIRPCIDYVWREFGYGTGSRNYDEAGVWDWRR